MMSVDGICAVKSVWKSQCEGCFCKISDGYQCIDCNNKVTDVTSTKCIDCNNKVTDVTFTVYTVTEMCLKRCEKKGNEVWMPWDLCLQTCAVRSAVAVIEPPPPYALPAVTTPVATLSPQVSMHSCYLGITCPALTVLNVWEEERWLAVYIWLNKK